MEKWYKKSYWRNLVDMHIHDWNPAFMSRFSGQAYANMMERAQVDTAEIYAGNCLGLCFFPTEVGRMHKGLQGQDIFGETLEELHKKGIRNIAYFNIWNRWAFDNHPSWRMQSRSGESTTAGNRRYGQCCLNSQGFQKFVQAQLEFLCDKYEFAGVWIDMIGWYTFVCYCSSCKDRYFAETGKEIPDVVDWADPEWVSFQRHRQVWNKDFHQIIDDTIRSKKPNATIAYQCGSWLQGWFTASAEEILLMGDYLAGDIYGSPLMYSARCKSMNSLTRNKPIEFMTSISTDLSHHTTKKTADELRCSIHGALAHNAAFTFIDAVNPDGTMDERTYTLMGELYNEVKPLFNFWNPEAAMLQDISIYTNFDSLFNTRSTAFEAYNVLKNMLNISSTMIRGKLLFSLDFNNSLFEACRKSPVILLDNTYMLDDDEVEALDNFVALGGCLIFSGLTGMYNKQGGLKNDFALSDIAGVHYIKETLEDLVYLSPVDKFQELFGDYNTEYPVSVLSPGVMVSIDDDVEVLAYLTLPYSRSDDIHNFSSAISNPPGIATDSPAVTIKNHGLGKVMYVAAPIQDESVDVIKDVLLALIKHIMPRPPYIKHTNAPAWLELLLYHDQDRDLFQLFLINSMETYLDAEICDCELTLELPGKITEVYDVANKNSLAFSKNGNSVSFECPHFQDFLMLILR